MSRHHMLPPIVYVPQPKPKKIETRKSRIYTRSAGSIEESGDVEETYQPVGFDRSAPAGQKPALENFSPIEGSENKPPSATGRLSEDTLKVMLLAQELKER
jgi:hypothetical protein